jgi:hypothetical protein
LSGRATLFDTFVIVDWSAAGTPKLGRDSIWICAVDAHGSERLVNNLPTRHEAHAFLAEFLQKARLRGERVLLGFDFPFGYPTGFAQRLGLPGTPWRAVWDEIARLIEDAPSNKNNRFWVGAELNRQISKGNGRFPFWGCPPAFRHEALGPRHHRGHTDDEPLKERRLIDCWMVGAQPCWKLAYTGSVGSQSLTGLPVISALRAHGEWAEHARIWPFETGLRAPDDEVRFVFAEVWPSWWRKQIKSEYGPPNDRAQVRSVAEIFAAAQRAAALPNWFCGDPSLSDQQRMQVETEEAWTLGVTARRPSRPLNERRRVISPVKAPEFPAADISATK